MGQRCGIGRGARDWTKEEMTAYLDWEEAEDRRVFARVQAEVDPAVDDGRRGMDAIWKRMERDRDEQEALYRGQ